jgi:hypothetical protein
MAISKEETDRDHGSAGAMGDNPELRLEDQWRKDMRSTTLSASLAALLVATGAFAQQATEQPPATQPQAAQQQGAMPRASEQQPGQQQAAATGDYCTDGFVSIKLAENGKVSKDEATQIADHEFTSMDKDKDGRLSPQEFAECMMRAAGGLQRTGARTHRDSQSDMAAFKAADTDGNGTLSPQEYLAAAEREFREQLAAAAANDAQLPVYQFIWVPAPVAAAAAQQGHGAAPASASESEAASHATLSFDRRDQNGDSGLTPTEWQANSPAITPEVVALHFTLLDDNKDGFVGKDEYVAAAANRFEKAANAQQANAQRTAPAEDEVPIWILYVY